MMKPCLKSSFIEHADVKSRGHLALQQIVVKGSALSLAIRVRRVFPKALASLALQRSFIDN